MSRHRRENVATYGIDYKSRERNIALRVPVVRRRSIGIP